MLESMMREIYDLAAANINVHLIINSVTTVEGYFGYPGMDYLTGITKVTLGNSVKTIGDYAFSLHSDLKEIIIPDSVTVIGMESFGGCSSLTSVTIPNSVTSIEDYAFIGSGLTSVVIPDSVKSIGGQAFQACGSLKTVTIGSGVTEIGQCAFMVWDSSLNITFKIKTGWKADSISISETELSDPANAGLLLTDETKYRDYTWTRS